ncbi:DUF2946 family protein [Bradyrhizobium genosp. P]|uniref:DUF2946 family protein n=1 Tax=Bradyrhizobium genosp. P TaxID=83641 RepID=UPI003CF56252
MANAAAIDDLALSQICRHATDGTPLSPADQHKHACDHCALCFAVTIHLLDAPPPVAIQHARSETSTIRQSARSLRLSLFSRYSVARPRGPPLGA